MKKKFNYWEIVHTVYPEDAAAKDAYGIVFDNRNKSGPYGGWYPLQPIIGYLNWKSGDQEFVNIHNIREIEQYGYKMHVAKPVTKEIIKGLKYNFYFMNKHYKWFDNLSLIEVLDKLNEYSRAIS